MQKYSEKSETLANSRPTQIDPRNFETFDSPLVCTVLESISFRIFFFFLIEFFFSLININNQSGLDLTGHLEIFRDNFSSSCYVKTGPLSEP